MKGRRKFKNDPKKFDFASTWMVMPLTVAQNGKKEWVVGRGA